MVFECQCSDSIFFVQLVVVVSVLGGSLNYQLLSVWGAWAPPLNSQLDMCTLQLHVHVGGVKVN